MKKKIVFAVATVFFAFATVFNMHVLQHNDDTDIVLEQASTMAQANLAEWLSDNLGGSWKAETQDCVITNGTTTIHSTNCSIYIWKYGGAFSCDCGTTTYTYTTTYPYSVCVSGHGSCWNSDSCG